MGVEYIMQHNLEAGWLMRWRMRASFGLAGKGGTFENTQWRKVKQIQPAMDQDQGYKILDL